MKGFMARCTAFQISLLGAVCMGKIAEAQTAQVDLRNYIYQSPAGTMFCQSNGQLCTQGFSSDNGEFIYQYTNGITDYIARSITSPYYIGVMRNIDPNSGGLRCFSQPDNSPCTSPPNSAFPPQSAPMIFNTNVATAQDAIDSENPDGSPRTPIPGYTQFYNNNQALNFGVYLLDANTCSQSFAGSVSHNVIGVLVSQVNFGGDIGIRDALAIDEYEAGDPGHMERFYYVAGLGRVRDGAAYYDSVTGVYDQGPSNNSVRNLIRQSTISQPASPCAQGTAPLQ